jgi:hypothetical protein
MRLQLLRAQQQRWIDDKREYLELIKKEYFSNHVEKKYISTKDYIDNSILNSFLCVERTYNISIFNSMSNCYSDLLSDK